MSKQINELKYVNAVVEAEKKVFSLKTLRDRLEQKYTENKNVKADNPYGDAPDVKIECNLLDVPEKPIFNKKSKNMLLSRKLFKYFKYAALVMLLLFVVTMLMTSFFAEAFSEAGIFGYMFIIALCVTVLLFLSSVGLSLYDTLRFEEEMKEWQQKKYEIDEYNQSEEKRVFGEAAVRRAKYEMNMEEVNQRQEELSLVGNARAEVFALIKGKVVKNLYNSDNNLTELYAVDAIPLDYRRIDIVMLLQKYMTEAEDVSIADAIAKYNSELEAGNVALHLSDIYDNEEKFRETMACFCETADETVATVDGIMQKANEFVEEISSKAVNVPLRSINSGMLSLEFQRTYDDSDVAKFALSLE